MTEQSIAPGHASAAGDADTGADTTPGADSDPRILDQVRDTGDGCFAVRTVTGSYLLDLSGRRLLRRPVTLTDQGLTLTWTLDVDGIWLPLVHLHECTVGANMRAVVRVDDRDQPLRTSPVHSIRPVDPTPGR